MKQILKPLVIIGLSALLLSSCEADVDLKNIDNSAQVNMGLAMPLGTMSASLGDFLDLGDGIISVREDGVFRYVDTFVIQRNFHAINLEQYMTHANQEFIISEQIPMGGLSQITLPAGNTYKLSFPMKMTLNNLNNTFENERVDSIYVKNTEFISSFSLKDLEMNFNDIDKVEITLDEHCSRAKGKTLEIPLQGSSFGENIPINVDDFTISFIKDPTKDPDNSNVINEMGFIITFTIIPQTDLIINTLSAFTYDFDINFLEYEAIWGWFKPSKFMRDSREIVLADEWDVWKDLKDLKVKLAEPSIDCKVSTSLGMPLTVNLDYLYVENPTTTIYAMFNNNKRLMWSMPEFVRLNDPLDKVAVNYYTFDKNPSNGAIDKLFDITPEKLAYSYEIVVNSDYSSEIKQHRLGTNTDIDLEVTAKIPFIFKEGAEFSYSDTLQDVDFSSLAIEDLISDIDFVDSLNTKTLQLMIGAESYIPFAVKAEFEFLDENGQPVDLSLTEEGNILNIPAPQEIRGSEVIKPAEALLTIALDQKGLENLPKVKSIVYKAFLGDNVATAALRTDTSLKFNIGLAVDVEAFLNLNFLTK